MPVRKSDISKTPTAVEDGSSLLKDSLSGLNIEDLSLPKSIVIRLAKSVLPANTQIQANAMLGISKSATLFINYIASQANEKAAAANRKTVSANDVFEALEDSQFAEWRPRLEAELQKHSEMVSQRKGKLRSKDTDGAPVAKKLKRDRSSASLSDDNTNHDNDQERNESSDPEIDEQKDGAGYEIDESDDDDDYGIVENDDKDEADLNEEQASIETVDEALDNGDDSD